jgi:hypothetical protein
MTSSADTVIIPEAPEELAEPARSPGQDFGNPQAVYPAQAAPGHKSDDDSFYRSRNKQYKKKILKQKARSKA